MGEGDAVFSARVLECAKGWLEHWPPECLRAVLGDAAPPSRSHGAEADADVDVDAALADAVLIAARRAAPAILALERLVTERCTRRDGASTTVVELCGASRGHVLGALLASMKMEGVAEVVIVDNRWPRTGAGDDASRDAAAAAKGNTLPTSHMDATDGWWTSRRAAPPHRWKASVKNASHLRSLNAALRRARIAIGESSGISIVANGVGGTGELRALQLYHAPYGIRTRDSTTDADDTTDQDVALVLLPGDPPERDEACRRNLLYRAGPTHEFAVKRLWPRRDRRDPAGPSIETYAKTAWTAHLVAGAGGEVQTSSSEVKTSMDGCHDDAPPLVLASRASALELGAPSGNRTLDDAFGPVALTVVEQLAAVNAEVLMRLGSADIGVLGDDLDLSDNSCPIALRRVEPGRWTSGGYCEHHYVPEPPGPHGLCFEAFTRTTDSSEETNKNPEHSVPVGFIALTAYGDDDRDRDEYPLTDDDDTKMGKYNAKPGGTLTGAQVDRLCVLPGARGRGVKERLLRCADGFHSVGLPVRVKTASRTAAESFVRCPLLAYDGFKDPTKAGVSKRRGTKTVVVVDGEDPGERVKTPARTGTIRGGTRTTGANVPLRSRVRSPTSDDNKQQQHPAAERDPASATRAALNRAAPDTVAACVDKIAAALRCSASSSGESSGTISPETLAAADLIVKRGAKEPSFRAVYADIARGVASKVGCGISNSFADAVSKSTLAPFQTRCAPGKGGTLLAGHAVFAAELHHRQLVTAEDVGAVARRLAEGADAEVSGDSGVDSATCVPALCALVDALDAAATAALGDEATGLVRDVLGRVEDGVGHDMGGRARFLAGRASLTLSSARVESHTTAGTTLTTKCTTKGFGAGRGKARPMDARAMTRAEVHASARVEMRMEVVQSGSTRAVDRGMRRGWTFAYVGSPVRTRGGSITNNADLIRVFTPSEVVTDPAVLTEEAGSHRKGRYEWVPASVADERDWPTVGLPR